MLPNIPNWQKLSGKVKYYQFLMLKRATLNHIISNLATEFESNGIMYISSIDVFWENRIDSLLSDAFGALQSSVSKKTVCGAAHEPQLFGLIFVRPQDVSVQADWKPF